MLVVVALALAPLLALLRAAACTPHAPDDPPPESRRDAEVAAASTAAPPSAPTPSPPSAEATRCTTREDACQDDPCRPRGCAGYASACPGDLQEMRIESDRTSVGRPEDAGAP